MAMASPSIAASTSLASVLDLLRALHPPRHVVHVGPGDGVDLPPYSSWGADEVCLVEARRECCAALQRNGGHGAGMVVLHACAGARSGPGEFHRASNPAYSACLAPESLRGLWPNLHSLERTDVELVTLDALLSATSQGATPDWLVVDCMPALPVLLGAATALEQVDLVVARVLDEVAEVGVPGLPADEIDALLVGCGLRPVACIPQWHPRMMQRVYLRDWKRQASATLHSHGDKLAQLRGMEEAYSQERDSFETLAALMRVELGEAIAQAVQAKDGLAGAQQELQHMRETLVKRDQLQVDSQARIAELEQALESQEVQAARAADDAQALGLRLELEGREARQHIARLQTELEAYGRESASASLAMGALQAKLLQQQEELADTQQQRDQLARAQERLESDGALVRSRLEGLLLEIGHANEALEAERIRNHTLDRAIQEQQGAAERWRAESESLRQAHAQAIDALRQDHAQAMAAQSQVQAELRASVAASQTSEEAQRRAAEVELAEQRRQTQHWQAAHDLCQRQLAAAEERATSLEHRLGEMQAQWNTLSQAQAQVTAERDEHARVSRERLAHIEGLVQTAGERDRQLADLQTQRAELEARQHLLDQEIVKAEAQIELIKDVVLREKAF